MSTRYVRFTSRYEPMPKIATRLGTEIIAATRYIEYDLVTQTGRMWYAVAPYAVDPQEVRCIHDPCDIVGEQDLAMRLLGLLTHETLNPGWPDDLKTCEEMTASGAPTHAG